jgi:hypothetical protein
MRIGINIPDKLYERFKPLKSTHNISQVCRDAIESLVRAYETALTQAEIDGVQVVADRLWIQYSKESILDWQDIGRENAKKWTAQATLEDIEDLLHNYLVHQRLGKQPEEFLGRWRVPNKETFEYVLRQNADWFRRQRDLNLSVDPLALAEADYQRGWTTYMTAVRTKLVERIEEEKVARRKTKQEIIPEIPINILDSANRRNSIKRGGK